MRNLKYLLLTLPIFASLLFIKNLSFKTTKPVENELVWMTSVDEAYKISKKTKKPILADFTGSDWCGWCHKLSKEVFNTPEFKTWSDKNVVLLELDFPRTKTQTEELKAQNNSLMQFFKVQGFPTIHVFNLKQDKKTKKYDIDPIGGTGYMPGGPAAFTAAIDGMIVKYKDTKKNPPVATPAAVIKQ
jgi:thioredoxin-related protein